MARPGRGYLSSTRRFVSGRQIVGILFNCPIPAGAFADIKPFLLALV